MTFNLVMILIVMLLRAEVSWNGSERDDQISYSLRPTE